MHDKSLSVAATSQAAEKCGSGSPQSSFGSNCKSGILIRFGRTRNRPRRALELMGTFPYIRLTALSHGAVPFCSGSVVSSAALAETPGENAFALKRRVVQSLSAADDPTTDSCCTTTTTTTTTTDNCGGCGDCGNCGDCAGCVACLELS